MPDEKGKNSKGNRKCLAKSNTDYKPIIMTSLGIQKMITTSLA